MAKATKAGQEKYMRRCIELGLIAKENGSAPVGAVVVKEGSIIAEGFEGEQDVPSPIAHAELIAVLKAIKYRNSKDLSSCVLYTTKEPCVMCAYLIRQTGIKKVIYASPAGEVGGTTALFPVLVTPLKKWPKPPEIVSGFLQDECEKALNG